MDKKYNIPIQNMRHYVLVIQNINFTDQMIITIVCNSGL